jgi:hypothetical protein
MTKLSIKLKASGTIEVSKFNLMRCMARINMNHAAFFMGSDGFSGYFQDGVMHVDGEQPVRYLSLIVKDTKPFEPFKMTWTEQSES